MTIRHDFFTGTDADAFHHWRNSREEEFLEKEEEAELARRWKQDRDFAARDRIILAYRPLYLKMASFYTSRGACTAMDLVKVAELVALEEVDRFNPEEGRFSTFIMPRIKAGLTAFLLANSGPARIPAGKKNRYLLSNMYRLENIAWQENPEAGQGVISSKIADLVNREKPQYDHTTPEDVATFMAANKRGLTHYNVNPGFDQEESSVYDFIAASRSSDPAALIEADQDYRESSYVQQLIGAALQALNPREVRVVTARVLADDEKMTLEELGREFGVTTERARQIEAAAFKKMRKFMESHGIKERPRSESEIALALA